MGAAYWLRRTRSVARVYLLPVYSVMSIYIVVAGGRRVYVILNILLIFLEIVRLLCVLVS